MSLSSLGHLRRTCLDFPCIYCHSNHTYAAIPSLQLSHVLAIFLLSSLYNQPLLPSTYHCITWSQPTSPLVDNVVTHSDQSRAEKVIKMPITKFLKQVFKCNTIYQIKFILVLLVIEKNRACGHKISQNLCILCVYFQQKTSNSLR